MRWCWLVLLLVVGGLFVACQGGEGEKKATLEPYKIGLTADVTGTSAATYGGISEGFRNHFRWLNDRGGIDGHPVDVAADDNRSTPDLAIAATKRFAESGFLLVVDAALSATFLPSIAEAEKAGMLWLSGGVCSPETLPPSPKPTAFCAGWQGPNQIVALTQTVKDLTKDKPGTPKVALIGVDAPIARLTTDAGERTAKQLGMEVVARADVPPNTTDFTSYADRFISAGADWVVTATPKEINIPTFEALQRRGWKGNYILNFAMSCGEGDLQRLKADNLMILCLYTPLTENLPVHKDVREAAKKYSGSVPVEEGHVYGWMEGLMVEHLLRQCGWPCTREKLLDTARRTEFTKDTFQGLQPGPTRWAPTDHGGVRYAQVVRWDSSKKKITPVTPWIRQEVEVGKLTPLP
ncbi:MAG TPA: ABC transporter substrate-binding protein [Dehalococcoidia bacterium]|nr:ABC transporter substrate-binding protein [Dehalococcoidia bacterium]